MGTKAWTLRLAHDDLGGWLGQMARKFELHDNHVHQPANGRPTRVDDEVCRLPVQRITQRMQIAQPVQGIGHLQQRPVHVVPQTAKQLIWRGVEVNHLPPVVQLLAVGRPQYNPTPCGQDTVRLERELANHRLFNITKAVFPLTLKILADRAAKLLPYHMVRIKERQLKPPRKLPPDGGFSGTGQAYEAD